MIAGTTDLIDEFGGSPPQRLRRGLSTEDAIAPSILQADTMNKLLTWLRERHQEQRSSNGSSTTPSIRWNGRVECRPARSIRLRSRSWT